MLVYMFIYMSVGMLVSGLLGMAEAKDVALTVVTWPGIPAYNIGFALRRLIDVWLQKRRGR